MELKLYDKMILFLLKSILQNNKISLKNRQNFQFQEHKEPK